MAIRERIAFSVRVDGEWFDTTATTPDEAATQLAAAKGWPPGSWRVVPMPPTMPSYPIARRRFAVTQRFGRKDSVLKEVQSSGSAGFIVATESA